MPSNGIKIILSSQAFAYNSKKFSRMPYRRLPNTDAARIRAMKNALRISQELPPNKMAISPRSFVSLQRLIPLFENNILLQRQSFTFQYNRSGDYSEILRKARLYLIHFIRVMNMAISRGELPPETREFYGMKSNNATVPYLKTESELITWGRRIIEGEEQRIRKGGSPITNPTIAVVKVRFESFIESNNNLKLLTKRIHDYSAKATLLRKEADDLILQVWNEAEEAFADLPPEIRKKECEKYGIVYFYRRSEKLKQVISGDHPSVFYKQVG